MGGGAQGQVGWKWVAAMSFGPSFHLEGIWENPEGLSLSTQSCPGLGSVLSALPPPHPAPAPHWEGIWEGPKGILSIQSHPGRALSLLCHLSAQLSASEATWETPKHPEAPRARV